MTADRPLTLCSWEQFTSGAFNDLARNYNDPAGQAEILAEATRLCEQVASRRLVPFTGLSESHRATGGDPDEYPGGPAAAISLQATLAASYSSALGSDDGVRHIWLNEYAPRHPELWTYADVQVTVETTFGGTPASITVSGPEVDSGHVWLRFGSYVPVGSMVRATYGGGFTVAIPADLVRAGKLMTASLIMRELAPTKQTRDPRALWEDAALALAGYTRD